MEVFVARQPIFNRREEVHAYELLYRSSIVNAYNSVNHDHATAEVIVNSFLNIGIDQLSNGKPCFINFTEKLLQLRLPTYFRPREIVVEILESVPLNEDLLKICRELKSLGYLIALDDYVFNEKNPYSQHLLRFADIIKVDFRNTTRENRRRIESLGKLLHLELLAEKVETRAEFEQARKSGYHYFQGYFFSKPVIVSTHDVPTYFHSYYGIIQNLAMAEPSIAEIAELIEQDLSLSYKLLKLINSPAFRPRNKINSIRQAIVMLGLVEIQKWIYVLSVREMTGDRPKSFEETIHICLARGKMSESIGKHLEKTAVGAGYFMAGMFSLMDTILSLPMKDVLKDLPLHEDITRALLGEQNILRSILDLVIDVEKANWDGIEKRCLGLDLTEADVFTYYKKSLDWANHLLKREDEGLTSSTI
ncbi:HDOD domain-containing protein [Peribacillus saganii]|uniref:HDOD domain-containing protein n=1 Tax=Peribacillus saganii TaxID=2303992 RepID=A0A372LL36_9BACI|nr:HDOD domain-containing protein [Peribacillus saganii]RFU66418.1 HDOD domain-containing protein [Peribacillus saganii]